MPALDMPLFVEPDDVIIRMSLDKTLDGIYDSLANAIMGAQLHVERITQSKLQRQTFNRTYFLDGEAFSDIQPDGVFRLELPSGFVRSDVSPTITFGPTRFGELVTADPTLYEVDHTRGYLLMDKTVFRDQYVKVVVETGFEDGTNPVMTTGVDDWSASNSYTAGDRVVFDSLVYECTADAGPAESPTTDPLNWRKVFISIEGLPSEVTEAILSLVPTVMESGSAPNSQSASARPQFGASVKFDTVTLLLEDYIRVRGFSFRPL